MKIVILGTGAMGTLFGGRLALAGEDVTLLYRRQEAADKVNASGVRIDSPQGTQNIPVPAIRVEALREKPDVVLIFTKAMQTPTALEAIKPCIGSNTYLFSLQNGLRAFDQLRQHADLEHIILGVTNYPSDLIADGHVTTGGEAFVKLARADNKRDAVVEGVNTALNKAGFNSHIAPDIFVSIWEKATFNIGLNSTTGICRATCGEIGGSPEGRSLAHRLGDEVLAVARAQGIPVCRDTALGTIDASFIEHKDHYSSMAQDIMAQRKTEIEALHACVLEKADALGVPVPAIEITYQLLRTIESLWK